jgi:hypothetical protein
MYVLHEAMYKVPIIIRVSQSSKKTAMQQMQKGLDIRISQRGRFPPRETFEMGTTGCKCRSSFGDHGIIGKSVDAV